MHLESKSVPGSGWWFGMRADTHSLPHVGGAGGLQLVRLPTPLAFLRAFPRANGLGKLTRLHQPVHECCAPGVLIPVTRVSDMIDA